MSSYCLTTALSLHFIKLFFLARIFSQPFNNFNSHLIRFEWFTKVNCSTWSHVIALNQSSKLWSIVSTSKSKPIDYQLCAIKLYFTRKVSSKVSLSSSHLQSLIFCQRFKITRKFLQLIFVQLLRYFCQHYGPKNPETQITSSYFLLWKILNEATANEAAKTIAVTIVNGDLIRWAKRNLFFSRVKELRDLWSLVVEDEAKTVNRWQNCASFSCDKNFKDFLWQSLVDRIVPMTSLFQISFLTAKEMLVFRGDYIIRRIK